MARLVALALTFGDQGKQALETALVEGDQF